METYNTCNYSHFPMVEKLVDILSTRNQNPDKNFFTILVCYHLSKIPAMMRVNIDALGMGKLLINFYGINCAPSGYGKGYSTKIIEEQVTNQFRDTFMGLTFPQVSDRNLVTLSVNRAIKNGTDDATELEAVTAEYRRLGAYVTSFDSGTTPALKQFRHKLLMSSIGSINLEVDEMGSNLLGNKEILDTYLELYEGVVKPKLTKNTAESIRNEEIIGKTPTNMLMFGTAATLLDGAQTEKTFMDMLTTGYARRCFFGFSSLDKKPNDVTFDFRMKMLMDQNADTELNDIAVHLEKLADPINHNASIKVPQEVLEEVVKYQMYCEGLMNGFKSTDEIRKAEARGRYYKTLRLAGTFAFIDMSLDMKLEHWQAAVKVAEMSAKCFDEMLKTDPAHVRLAKYLAECKEPTTFAELVEELPFFPKGSSAQKDILRLSIAHGHKNNIIIKRTYVDDIEFVQGESLKKTDLDELNLSWVVSSFTGESKGFKPEYKVPFSQLNVLTTLKDCHWCTHHFTGGHRTKDNAIKGFNLLVLDVDEGTSIEAAKSLLKDYTYHIYTTTNHRKPKGDKPPCDRFRIVLPMNYMLKLSKEEYKEFMQNIFEFLPFKCDEQTSDISRKWMSNENADIFDNSGDLFDVLPFIPKTRKNEERRALIETIGSLDALEKYFYQTMIKEGGRNNNLFRYGAILLDSGYGLDALLIKVKDFNKKLEKPLGEDELQTTVLYSLTNKFFERSNKK